MKINYSVVIPLLNEAQSLLPLWDQLSLAMNKLEGNWEAIFVNDGSTDNSLPILENLAKENPAISIINFPKNRGKADALTAGFKKAQGEIVITMDADLQDNPAEITKLLDKLNEGYDLVSGYKKNRHDPLHKTIPSHFFNGMVRLLFNVKLHDINCGLKAYRKEVLDNLSIHDGLYRFIPILANAQGFRVTEVPVLHRARKFGYSKYGAKRLVTGFIDLFAVKTLVKNIKPITKLPRQGEILEEN